MSSYGTLTSYSNLVSYGKDWFNSAPKIGGTSYDDPLAEDVMSIRDLGVIDTQEQLDNLSLLPTGLAKFRCAYEIMADTTHQYGFVFGEKLSTAGSTYDYRVETISNTETETVVQFIYSNNWLNDKPIQLLRRGYVLDGSVLSMYPSYLFATHNDLEFVKGDALIKSPHTLDIIAPYGVTFRGNTPVAFNDFVNFSKGVQFLNGTVLFDFGASVVFNKTPSIQNRFGFEKKAAVAQEYLTSDVTSVAFEIAPWNADVDMTYTNPIESFEISSSGTAVFADGSIVSFHFDTGDAAPTISYLIELEGETPIFNWIGTDCALDDGISVFAPSPNKHYDIFIGDMGGKVVALVNGFTPATSNQRSDSL